MAIPFYEPKHSQQEADGIGDQVDGHEPPPMDNQYSSNNDSLIDLGFDDVDYEAPMTHLNTSVPIENLQTPVGSDSSSTSTQGTLDQLKAWKLLALAMCKALKLYYIQNANTSNASSSTFSVHLIPNGAMQTKWK